MADREEEPPASPASAAAAVAAPSTYPLILRIMSKRRTWACLFVLVYAVLLSSTWNSLKSILAWYQSQANQHPSSGWPALYASVLLGAVFGVLSMVAALAVAIPATLVTWITVVVLLAFFGKPKRTLVHEGSKMTKEIVGMVGKVLLKEGNVWPRFVLLLGTSPSSRGTLRVTDGIEFDL